MQFKFTRVPEHTTGGQVIDQAQITSIVEAAINRLLTEPQTPEVQIQIFGDKFRALQDATDEHQQVAADVEAALKQAGWHVYMSRTVGAMTLMQRPLAP